MDFLSIFDCYHGSIYMSSQIMLHWVGNATTVVRVFFLGHDVMLRKIVINWGRAGRQGEKEGRGGGLTLSGDKKPPMRRMVYRLCARE